MATVVTAKELGQSLKLSESTIYKLANDGELPGYRIGDLWRFDLDEIIKVIKTQRGQKRRGIHPLFPHPSLSCCRQG
jgi:excisionase family DNA binding protein